MSSAWRDLGGGHHHDDDEDQDDDRRHAPTGWRPDFRVLAPAPLSDEAKARARRGIAAARAALDAAERPRSTP